MADVKALQRLLLSHASGKEQVAKLLVVVQVYETII